FRLCGRSLGQLLPGRYSGRKQHDKQCQQSSASLPNHPLGYLSLADGQVALTAKEFFATELFAWQDLPVGNRGQLLTLVTDRRRGRPSCYRLSPAKSQHSCCD